MSYRVPAAAPVQPDQLVNECCWWRNPEDWELHHGPFLEETQQTTLLPQPEKSLVQRSMLQRIRTGPAAMSSKGINYMVRKNERD